MIEKIISSGQAGVSAVALDVAIKLGLTYSGWCCEDEPIREKYRIERLPGVSYGAITEKAVGAGHGSLYLTEGDNTSLRLETTKKIALRLNKPLLVLNLSREDGFFASRRVAVWIGDNKIKVLHVDGEGNSASDRVAGMLEATFFLAMIDAGITSPMQSIATQEQLDQKAPIVESMEAAVNHLEAALSLKDRATIANMAAGELVSLNVILGEYINQHFDLFSTDSKLLTDCRHRSGQWDLAPTDAAAVIIRALWERLHATCRIRIIK